jgi:hypothetical protein
MTMQKRSPPREEAHQPVPGPTRNHAFRVPLCFAMRLDLVPCGVVPLLGSG